MAKCLEKMIEACMENHTYTFNGTVRLQRKGGAIGLKVTQAVARLYMMWWDKQFLALADKAGAEIKMYKRYVDDTNIIIKTLNPGQRWDKVAQQIKVYPDKVEEDQDTENDVRTAREIRKMADSIDTSIQWEEAVPSKSPGGKLPILDLQCWSEQTEEGSTKIYYAFYRKPMANRLLMLHQSALPDKMKRTTLTQEVIRIMRNCHPDLPWEEKVSHLNTFTERMRDSGYPERYRAEVIQSGLKGYEKMLEVEKTGGRPVNRLKKTNQEERRRQKLQKKDTWYKEGGFSTVLFVPCTPGGILCKKLKEIETRGREDRQWSVKIIEMGGQTLRSQLSKSNPWQGKCFRETCFPCKGDKGGQCQRRNVGYVIECDSCKAEYHGETSRTMYSRGEEHLKSLNRKDQDSVLWEHCLSHHGGEQVPFTMRATGYYAEPLSRQINEAVRIYHSNKTMNRKSEWRKAAVPRATFSRE